MVRTGERLITIDGEERVIVFLVALVSEEIVSRHFKEKLKNGL